MDTGRDGTRELPVSEIDVFTDTRDVLAHAKSRVSTPDYSDFFIVDIDAHHSEVGSWNEIIAHIEDPVVRRNAQQYAADRGGKAAYGLNVDVGMRYQDMGRIPHQAALRENIPVEGVHRDVVLARRAMEGMGIDVMVLFPTPMLFLGLHPQEDMEVTLGRAYNRWLTEELLPQDSRLRSLLFLPFNTPKAALQMVRDFADKPGVIGFMVTSARHKPVHHDDYMPLYAELEERGMPLSFHASTNWQDQSMRQVNRFIGMHALSFVWCNMVHMTNWVLNGLPERFPKLDVIWIESGLAYLPFLMQRLDSEYLMRSSEAPLLKRRPGEYISDMYFSTQPIETQYPKAVECTFEMINAETQLLFASDWPHWDFNTPGTILDLPFLSEQAKRNILGLNAKRLFNLD